MLEPIYYTLRLLFCFFNSKNKNIVRYLDVDALVEVVEQHGGVSLNHGHHVAFREQVLQLTKFSRHGRLHVRDQQVRLAVHDLLCFTIPQSRRTKKGSQKIVKPRDLSFCAGLADTHMLYCRAFRIQGLHPANAKIVFSTTLKMPDFFETLWCIPC